MTDHKSAQDLHLARCIAQSRAIWETEQARIAAIPAWKRRTAFIWCDIAVPALFVLAGIVGALVCLSPLALQH